MTSNQDSKKENTNQETSTCLKGDSCHWVIEPPNGPTSLGKCKKCGKRDFCTEDCSCDRCERKKEYREYLKKQKPCLPAGYEPKF